jgi:hypothetical protein
MVAACEIKFEYCPQQTWVHTSLWSLLLGLKHW